jgi:hypothetical protein
MNCPRKNCKNKAIQDPTYGVLPCKSCQNSTRSVDKRPEFSVLSRHNRITEQRDLGSKDTIQPYEDLSKGTPNPEFVKAFPDQAPQYFSQEQLAKL